MNLRINNLYLVIALVFASPFAWAGRDVGNGGDAVVCKDSVGNVTSVHSLDRFEGQKLRGRDIVLDTKTSSDPWLQATAIVSRAEGILTRERLERYKDQISHFGGEAKFISGVILRDIPDSVEPFLPAGCGLEQLVIQSEPEMPGDFRYLVNDDLWTQLAIEDRVAVILHEIIYREVVDRGHKDSRRVRNFNSWIYSTDFVSAAPATVVAIFKQMNLTTMRLHGIDIDLFQRNSDGSYDQFNWIGPDDLTKPFDLSTSVANDYTYGDLKVNLGPGLQKFFALDKPEVLCVANGKWDLNNKNPGIVLAKSPDSPCSDLYINNKGRVVAAFLGPNHVVFTNFYGEVVFGRFEFDPNSPPGKLVSVGADIEVAQVLDGNTWQKIESDHHANFEFFDSGSVKSINLNVPQGLTYAGCNWMGSGFEFYKSGHVSKCKAANGKANYRCGTQAIDADEINQEDQGHLNNAKNASLWIEGPNISRQHVFGSYVTFYRSGAVGTMKDTYVKTTFSVQGNTSPLEIDAYEVDFSETGAIKKANINKPLLLPIRMTGFGNQTYKCSGEANFDDFGNLAEVKCPTWENQSSQILFYPATNPDSIVIHEPKPSFGPRAVLADQTKYNFTCYCDNAYIRKSGVTVCDRAWGQDDHYNHLILGCSVSPDGSFTLKPDSSLRFNKADGSLGQVKAGEWAYFDSLGYFVESRPTSP